MHERLLLLLTVFALQEDRVDGLQQSKASIEEEISKIKEDHEQQVATLQKDIDQAKNL